MNIVVLGAGRMGIRHCLGVLKVPTVKCLYVIDISKDALANAKTQLENKHNGISVEFLTLDDFFNIDVKIHVVIIAATAGNRLETCEKFLKFSPEYFLVEKPLGQSLEQVKKLIDFFDKHKEIKAFVNLNTRIYPAYQKLKQDLKNSSQFKGLLTFSINTGTLGIGANGIHYIDLLKYLTDAEKIQLVTASVDDTVIPSGRGPAFADFGGFAVLDYFDKNKNKVARAHLILGSQSTVFGPWEIVGANGRILIDEFEQMRFNKYRKADSVLPVQRYAGDYLPMETEQFEIPFLNDLTEQWLNKLVNNEFILPELKDSLAVHETMFNWLNHSKKYQHEFPIT